jgi:uncharacterized protein (DUF362 family)
VRHALEAFPQALAKAKGGRVLLKPNMVEAHPVDRSTRTRASSRRPLLRSSRAGRRK